MQGKQAMETLARGMIKIIYDSGAAGFSAEIMDPEGYTWKLNIKKSFTQRSAAVKPRGWNTPRSTS